MKVYNEVPMWWYILVFIGSFAMAMSTIYTGHSGLPWYVHEFKFAHYL
jgi:hypothetical protein